MGITTTFFICYNLAISSFNKLSFLIFSLSQSHTLKSLDIVMPDHCLFLYFINYCNIWSSGFYHVIILYGEIERVWNFCFQLHFLSHVHTKSLLYWILASHKTAIIHIFLHYHTFVCTPFRQVCHIHSPYQI